MRLDSRLRLLFDVYSDLGSKSCQSEVLTTLAVFFDEMGFSATFISGIPLPNRPIKKLVFQNNWYLQNRIKLKPMDTDIVYLKALDWNNTFVLKQEFHNQTSFCGDSKYWDSNDRILVSPIYSIPGYQGVVVNRFNTTLFEQFMNETQPISMQERILFSSIVNFAFHSIYKTKSDQFLREGKLTNREKDVLSVCALGNTSAQTAEILSISERTVITHLQNASKKMCVSNRTECVLQAIRYRQIGPGAGYGFYQIEHEIYV